MTDSMMVAALKRHIPFLVVLAGMFWAPLAAADLPGIPAFTVQPGEGEGVEEYSVTLQILALMTALTFLPAMLMMMTSFTRIIVVFAILRQALRSEEHTSELQSRPHLVCRLLLE